MADQSGSQADQARVLATVTRLVTAADGDTLYRDVYLRHAAEILSPIITEATYVASLTSREQLDRMLAQARAAVTRKDWTNVGELGTRAASLQRALAADKGVLAAAEAVYASAPVALDPLSPGLSSKRWSNAAQARAEVCAVLAELARDDAASRELYASRQRALEALALPGASAPGAPSGEASAGSIEQQALQALERGDAAALKGLAESMLGRRSVAQPGGGEQAATARGAITVPAVLGKALPAACLPRAKP